MDSSDSPVCILTTWVAFFGPHVLPMSELPHTVGEVSTLATDRLLCGLRPERIPICVPLRGCTQKPIDLKVGFLHSSFQSIKPSDCTPISTKLRRSQYAFAHYCFPSSISSTTSLSTASKYLLKPPPKPSKCCLQNREPSPPSAEFQW